MKIILLAGIGFACLCLTACLSLGDSDKLTKTDIEEFETWYKVNKEPLVGSAGGALQGKHLEREGMREVYINDIGKPVSTGEMTIPFPVGTIIVKDTFYRNGDGSRGKRWNITVMRKREPGYDSSKGDWEYAEAAPSKSLGIVGKWNLCIDCHVYARKDYVFTWE